jgi:hypothetical protein
MIIHDIRVFARFFRKTCYWFFPLLNRENRGFYGEKTVFRGNI